VLWKSCCKTDVFKLFSLITLVWYHLPTAILSLLLGYSRLYCKSSYLYPQGKKYIRILLCSPLNKRHYSFLQCTYQNCYYTVIYFSTVPSITNSINSNTIGGYVTHIIHSTGPSWSINVWWTNEFMTKEEINLHSYVCHFTCTLVILNHRTV
jgi:hypothetical protein